MIYFTFYDIQRKTTEHGIPQENAVAPSSCFYMFDDDECNKFFEKSERQKVTLKLELTSTWKSQFLKLERMSNLTF